MNSLALRAFSFSSIAIALLFFNSAAVAAETPADAKSAVSERAGDNPALRKFMHSTKGTYGWQPVKGSLSYDFFPDGRVHIQGPDGEASMSQGTWSLVGNKVTIIEKSKKKTTMTVERDGDDLLLAEQRYHRSRP
jgi:hypothetical protein